MKIPHMFLKTAMIVETSNRNVNINRFVLEFILILCSMYSMVAMEFLAVLSFGAKFYHVKVTAFSVARLKSLPVFQWSKTILALRQKECF